MTNAEMEEAIRNHEQRLTNVEQILPTLATKDDVAESRHHTMVLFESVRNDIRPVAEAVAALAVKVEQGFASVEHRFGGVDQRLDRMDVRFDRMDGQLDLMDARFNRMDERFDRMDARFDRMDERVGEVDAHVIAVDQRLHRLERGPENE